MDTDPLDTNPSDTNPSDTDPSETEPENETAATAAATPADEPAPPGSADPVRAHTEPVETEPAPAPSVSTEAGAPDAPSAGGPVSPEATPTGSTAEGPAPAGPSGGLGGGLGATTQPAGMLEAAPAAAGALSAAPAAAGELGQRPPAAGVLEAGPASAGELAAAPEPAAPAPEAHEPEAQEPEAHEPEAHEPAAVGEAAGAGASAEGEPSPEPAAAATVQGFEGGQVLTGAVLSVDENEIVVALADDKRGVIGRRHYSNDPKVSLPEQVKPGDPIEGAVLVREDREDRIVLSRTWALKQDAWRRIEEARAAGAPVSGRVTEVVKGGLVLDLGVRAFMPASQVELHHVDNLGAYLGQTIEALVAEIDRDADKAVLSRRQLLRRQEKVKANEFLATLAPGQVHRGKVATLADFGAFVEFGGVRGLLHLSEMSWQRVERADDVVRLGQEISFKILSIKNNGKRISLSMRALSGDPLQGLQVGAVLSGVVTRLVDFGAFVRIGEGVEGLVHLSELAEYRVSLPEEVVAPGDEVLVKIINIDRKRRRVDLSINQAVQYS